MAVNQADTHHYYMTAINASTASDLVAQLVQKRTAVWPASIFCHTEKRKSFERRSIVSLSNIGNCWFVGLSTRKAKPFARKASLIFIANETA